MDKPTRKSNKVIRDVDSPAVVQPQSASIIPSAVTDFIKTMTIGKAVFIAIAIVVVVLVVWKKFYGGKCFLMFSQQWCDALYDMIPFGGLALKPPAVALDDAIVSVTPYTKQIQTLLSKGTITKKDAVRPYGFIIMENKVPTFVSRVSGETEQSYALPWPTEDANYIELFKKDGSGNNIPGSGQKVGIGKIVGDSPSVLAGDRPVLDVRKCIKIADKLGASLLVVDILLYNTRSCMLFKDPTQKTYLSTNAFITPENPTSVCRFIPRTIV